MHAESRQRGARVDSQERQGAEIHRCAQVDQSVALVVLTFQGCTSRDVRVLLRRGCATAWMQGGSRGWWPPAQAGASSSGSDGGAADLAELPRCVRHCRWKCMRRLMKGSMPRLLLHAADSRQR